MLFNSLLLVPEASLTPVRHVIITLYYKLLLLYGKPRSDFRVAIQCLLEGNLAV